MLSGFDFPNTLKVLGLVSTGLINKGASGRLFSLRLDVTSPSPILAGACRLKFVSSGWCLLYFDLISYNSNLVDNGKLFVNSDL